MPRTRKPVGVTRELKLKSAALVDGVLGHQGFDVTTTVTVYTDDESDAIQLSLDVDTDTGLRPSISVFLKSEQAAKIGKWLTEAVEFQAQFIAGPVTH